jgi:hypothetical protein
MNRETEKLYEAAMEPFLQPGSAIEAKHLQMRSWRYFVEINSGCNLSCPTCARGNKEGYEQKIGKMTRELYLKFWRKSETRTTKPSFSFTAIRTVSQS